MSEEHEPAPLSEEQRAIEAAEDAAIAQFHGILLRRTVPQTLYHYTSYGGFLGIIESRSVWATHAAYLNDAKETVVALDLLHDYLVELQMTGSEGGSHIGSALMDRVNNAGISDTFIASFTENGDQLSQWRGYAAGGTGLSLGFSAKSFSSVIARNGPTCLVAPCIYGEDDQERFVRDIVDSVVKMRDTLIYDRGVPARKATDAALDVGHVLLSSIAAVLKHHSFREENEWRIVLCATPMTDERVRFRQGRSFLIPYIPLKLRADDKPLRLNGMVIGPTPHPGAAVQSVKAYLAKQRVACPHVDESDAPYRDW